MDHEEERIPLRNVPGDLKRRMCQKVHILKKIQTYTHMEKTRLVGSSKSEIIGGTVYSPFTK